jgi:hypothetical protein
MLGQSPLSQTPLSTLPSIGSITTTNTQTGISRITATTSRTQSGVSRISITSLKTITGLSRITSTVSKTQPGLARITATVAKTQTGLSRITVTATKTQTGIARITATATKTQTGVANITNASSTAQTQTGISRLTATVTQTQTGVANITNASSTIQTQTGITRITAIIPTNVFPGSGHPVRGGYYIKSKRKKITRYPLDKMMDMVVREVYGELTGETAKKEEPELRKEAAEIVKPYANTKNAIPNENKIDWKKLEKDVETVKQLLTLWHEQIELTRLEMDMEEEELILASIL